jgi:hypothetical protein
MFWVFWSVRFSLSNYDVGVRFCSPSNDRTTKSTIRNVCFLSKKAEIVYRGNCDNYLSWLT